VHFRHNGNSTREHLINTGGIMERNNNRYEKYLEGASSFVGWYLAMNYAARFISKIIMTIVVMYLVFKYVCN